MALFFVTKRELPETLAEFITTHLLQGANVTLTKNTVTGDVTIASTGGGGGGVAGVTTFNSRDGAVTGVKSDYSSFFADLAGSYTNPAWIVSIPWTKITGAPTIPSQGITPSSSDTLTNKTINGSDNVITLAVSNVTGLQGALDAKEGTITTLPANKGGTGFILYTINDILVADSTTTLAKKTPAQLKAILGLDLVSNTSDATRRTTAETLTNKSMAGNANTFSLIPQSAIVSLTTDLASKLGTTEIGQQPQITLAYSAGASTWNMASGVNALITISGNVVITITASSFLTTYSPALRIIQTGSRGYTVSFVYSGATIYYSGGVLGNKLSTESAYRALATLRLVNNEIDVSIDPTYTTTP